MFNTCVLGFAFPIFVEFEVNIKNLLTNFLPSFLPDEELWMLKLNLFEVSQEKISLRSLEEIRRKKKELARLKCQIEIPSAVQFTSRMHCPTLR